MQVSLPSTVGDSLAAKVEALRVFLEQELGTEEFLQLYNLLEGLSPNSDTVVSAATVCSLVGEDKLQFIPLVHQLISCEELVHALNVPR